MEAPEVLINLSSIFIGIYYEFKNPRREAEDNSSLIRPQNFKTLLSLPLARFFENIISSLYPSINGNINFS